MSESEARLVLKLSVGRFLRMAFGAPRSTDVADYAACRAAALDAADVLGIGGGYSGASYARDRNRGAQGD